MPLTTALYTGMSGLNANQTALDVIGNNISNVNTTAFKGSRALFQPEFSETYSFGTAPGAVYGGSNPSQKGLGVRAGRIQRNFAAGNVKVTSAKTDVAIEGNGLFVIQNAERYFTRNGHFQLNAEDYLTTADGSYVMGYGIDENYNIVESALAPLRIPLNKITVARATSRILMDGQLGGGDDLVEATQGTTLRSDVLRTASGVDVAEDTALVDLRRYDGGAETEAFFEGTTLSFNGLRGTTDREQGARTLDVEATTTLGDLMDFMVDSFGIDTDAPPPAGATPAGWKLEEVDADDDGSLDSWVFDITGNVGAENAIRMGNEGLRSTSNTVPGPLSFDETEAAVGSSTHTSVEVYDSLGIPKEVDLTFVFESDDNSGRVWRWFANSPDDSDASTVLGSGTVSYDTQGNYLDATDTTFRVDLDDSGSLTPLQIEMDLSGTSGVVQGAGISDETDIGVTLASQDGEKAGTLVDFSIADDGQIMGSFSNDSTRVLGQLALATFSNYGGLVDAGQNLFKEGPNSGAAIVGAPLSNGAGRVWGGAIETSNIDISREFIDMIVASTGFSAASRVVTTSNQLLTELLQTVR
ncbi:MAG: flagellar hook protein FlgE [Planctomycetota bacterium]